MAIDVLKIKLRSGLYVNLSVNEIVGIAEDSGLPVNNVPVSAGCSILTVSGVVYPVEYSADDVIQYLVSESLVTVHEFTPQ